MNTEVIAPAAVVLGAAAVVFGYYWRKRYVLNLMEKRILGMIPADVVPGGEIELGEVAEFDGIAEFTCMEDCCYKALTPDEAKEYGLFLGDDD